MLLNLVGSSNADNKEILWKFINKFHKEIQPKDNKILDGLTEYAINYFKDKVEPNKKFKNPTSEEKKALKSLVKKLEELDQSLKPEDKFVSKKQNPPVIEIVFFDEQKNIQNINCFSNEGNEWRNSIMKFQKNTLQINFREKFTFRRGRVNCSIKEGNIWRWLGIQMSVELN